MTDMRSIRPLRMHDIPLVAQLATEVRRETYTPWMSDEQASIFAHKKSFEATHVHLRDYFRHVGAVGFVSVNGREIEGFILGNDDEEIISYLFVRHEAQGHGLGSALFEAFLGRNSKPYLIEVLEDNDRAIAMYERHGFRISAHPTKPYFGLRKLIMQRHIIKQPKV